MIPTKGSIFLVCLAYLLLCPAGVASQSAETTVPAQLIVQFQEKHEPGRLPAGFWQKKTLCRFAHIALIVYDTNQWQPAAALELIRQWPQVALAQPNHYLQARDTLPNDPLFEAQWQWRNLSDSISLPDADVDAELAWPLSGLRCTTAQGDTIVVALIDDGVQTTHPDLQPNLWRNHHEIPNNHLDDDGNGYIDDYLGWNPALNNDHINQGHHGTPVAGILGASWNNSLGGTGIAPGVQIMVVAGIGATEAEAIAAYAYVLEQRQLYQSTQGERGAFVVATNTSWGMNSLSPAEAPIWCHYYDLLGEAGIINCAATANADWNIDEVGDMPTACGSPYLISVTASDRMDERALAAYGPASVDLAAPGKAVLTTQAGHTYGFASGTSFASPAVAGTVALLYSANCPDLSALAHTDPAGAALLAKAYLLENVDVLPGFEGLVASGGRLNAWRALEGLADSCSDCWPVTGLTVDPQGAGTLKISWDTTNLLGEVGLFWRAQGDSLWQMATATQPPFTLEALPHCQAYEVEAQAHCGNAVSLLTPAVTAHTLGCCQPPAAVLPIQLSATSAILGWESQPDAGSYAIGLTGPNGLALSTTAEQPYLQVSGLSPCTTYEGEVARQCQEQTSAPQAFSFSTPGCGSCTDLEYCPSSGGTSGTEWIASFRFGTVYHWSGLSEGPNLYVDQNLAAEPGGSYPVSVKPGFLHMPFPEYIRMWIDFDHDGAFDHPEEMALDTLLLPPADSLEFELHLPPALPSGNTRLRLALKWAGFGSMPPLPCEPHIHYGEVEDYCLKILEAGSTATGARRRSSKPGYRVWPNPFRDQLHIELARPAAAHLELYSIAGQRVWSYAIPEGKSQVVEAYLPANLPRGTYQLTVQSAAGRHSQLLIRR